jgi:hypothetical protein
MANVKRKSKSRPVERAIPALTGDQPNRWRSGRNQTIRKPCAIPLKKRFAERIGIMVLEEFVSVGLWIWGESTNSKGLYFH